MINKISKKIGFTETEIKVILFLAFGFLVGFGIKIYKDSTLPEYKTYDYSEQDSLFNHYKSEAEKNLKSETVNNENGTVDSKQEVLDFNSQNFNETETVPLPAENSININTADLETLIQLPGIGEKTAQKIIELRIERGSFKVLDELLDVKGIGEAKFNKIKKFLYIEPSF